MAPRHFKLAYFICAAAYVAIVGFLIGMFVTATVRWLDELLM